VHPKRRVEWPLNRFDKLLVAQTQAGRPMTTHHTLEFDGAIGLDRWSGALAQLALDYPELGSRVVGRGCRIVFAPRRSLLLDRLIHEHDRTHAALERWIAAPIDPSRELPLRVRIGPGQAAEHAVTLSLHHSVCDGVGALSLFDRYLSLAAGEVVAPRVSAPFRRYRDAPAPGLRAFAAKLWQLRRPAAQLVDQVDRDARGQHLVLRMIPSGTWDALGRQTRAAGVSRTTALWHAIATVATRQRIDDATLPVRIIAGVDLRAHLGIPHDALGNWLGTMEHDSPPAIAEPHFEDRDAWRQLHAALVRARQPEQAVLTPALLAKIVDVVPPSLARAVFRFIDSDARPSPYSFLLAHLRPRGCWPLALQPRRLWCASTLPRKPALGLTFTTVGNQVCVAATCQAALLRRETVEQFLDALCDQLLPTCVSISASSR
jgi:hypothetical protein